MVLHRQPAGIDEPRYLKRAMLDGVFTTSGAGAVNVSDYSGAIPVWLSLGTVVADFGGSASGALQYGFGVTASLSALPAAAEITTLFREFQIVKLELLIESIMGDSYNGAAGSPIAQINVAYDPSDNTPAASYPAQIQYANNKVYNLVNAHPIRRVCVPKPAIAAYSSAIATAYAYPTSSAAQWFDCNVPLVPHYGYKCWVRNQINAANSGFGFRVTPILHIMMRRPR